MNSRLEALKKLVSSHPEDPRSHFELGCAAQSCQELELAVECFTRVTELADTVAVGYFNLGNACFSLRRFEQAAVAFQRAFDLSPDRGTLNNLGNASAAMGAFQQAILHYQHALELPDDGTGDLVVLKNLGTALDADGDHLGAVTVLREAIQRPECTPNIVLLLGRLLAKINPQEALNLLSSRAAVVQGSPELLALQADCLAAQHILEPALKDLMQACDLAPDHPIVLTSLGKHYLLRGRHFEALVCLHRALSSEAYDPAVHSAWLHCQLHQDRVDLTRFREECERWDAKHQQQFGAQDEFTQPRITHEPAALAGNNSSSRNSRLRCGLMLGSGGLERYRVLLQPLFMHTRDLNYEIRCYVDVGDAELEPFGSSDDIQVEWIATRDLGDKRLAQRIRSDGVEVLVDLTGHTSSSRLGVFARRAAPLQISWAGWLATTGLKSIDYLIADGLTVPSADSPNFTEQVLRMPGCLMCCLPPALDESHGEFAPEAATDSLTFGSVCSPTQLSEKLLSTWCRLLRKLPRSRLRLADPLYKDASLSHEVLEKFRAREIDPQRVELVGSFNLRAFLNSIQVTLDPYPWNAAEIACQSLQEGTPVVALRGDRLSSRTTVSVLTAAGLGQWIAESSEQYSELAAHIVAEPLSRLRLQQQVAASELCRTEAWSLAFINALSSLSGPRSSGPM